MDSVAGISYCVTTSLSCLYGGRTLFFIAIMTLYFIACFFLFTAHPDNRNEVLTDYEAAANTLRLHTNWQKTKVQNIGAGRWTSPDAVQMGSQAVKPATKFTYLGSDIDSDRCSIVIVEIHRRLGLANSIMGQLDGV